ncbi:MAG: protein-export membrane protein SecF [Candidatus Portnoybacteria bacterium RIFCSPLOWO2_12_FULL_39_9]|uniref:Protein-export membrane protein SecF n=1 Tax=Candidatus Portnoybacteria bacterium RIFCSPHIGHO2_12_FULL_38_9 TaxID=1801997 RepID=A0A1G2FFW3_9BACT|nr:MAG: protein-export membrane protein SecF [Candidatus Portnoybacteria bacterium RBG_13_40_8]OGZ36498.1 MAG: protein-export membrane protein SecF [Candidatus Portnoybacteria bacterium RIFCSPHIGHO2_12_FULL_38_9]OGZ37065.1 MAG: protein-export membrane protein SecF [Candidatus Portnoybacteria bacterium RIFCSPHIGHO2_02_FULL_39_12]OGZ39508.1 MAG: protein-export membrane protein SecF [Candidatus Portnoybacteria bacterium RIFCSPLOWO2_01_FULL_38_39]OGZ41313.1 MAG: protein-export membrane protein SecF
MEINIIRYHKIYFIISGLLVLASIFSLIFFGLKLGIDFIGGSLLQIEFKNERLASEAIKEKLKVFDLGEINTAPIGEKGVILRFKDIDEETHQKILNSLDDKYPENIEEKKFESIGPLIGEELKRKSIWAIGLVILMIILYIAYAFRNVSWPVASFKYGLAAILALIHDVLIPTGIFSFLGYWQGIEVNLLFITALLTILGFSVHDTIVVFDRIRENLKRRIGRDFKETVNLSINQTITRSINTSLTVLLTLLAVYIFGGQSIKYFALTLIFGIIFGTYSSIFIASPLIVVWEGWKKR